MASPDEIPASVASTNHQSVPVDGGGGGASPDSLRNTPSNIARLEDAIEHCAARRKYLARTKSPSDGEDVDLMRRHCFPVYWNGENRRVLRGHWFARKGDLDWIPLREDVSEQLELAYNCQVWHRRKFQPSGLFAARVDLQGSTPDLHALFTGEDDTWEAWLVFDTGPKLGGSTIKLKRGFSSSGSTKPTQDELRQQKEEEMDDYCSQVPVGHLVFMVHGIGQRLEKANLVDDVVDFRRVTTNLAERYLTPYQRSTQRVLFIPCQWRKSLKLSGEHTVEKITLDGVKGLRVALGATVHDVLYYMSPIYCQHIIDSVSNQLNQLYMKFLKRNPGYSGKVSIYAHSLGSVLSYDILCHQESFSAPFPADYMNMEVSSDEGQIAKLSDTITAHDSGIKEQDTSSTSGRSCADNVNDVVDEGSSRTDALCTEDTILPTHVLENSPKVATDALSTAVDGEQIEIVNQVVDHKMVCSEEGVTSSVIAKDADNSSILRSAEDVLDKDTLISSLREEVECLKARLALLEQQNDLVTETSVSHQGKSASHAVKSSGKQRSGQASTSESYTPHIRYTKLNFKVDTFFAVGSPLGVFLSLRNVRIGIGRGQDYWQNENIVEEMPCCRQMFNIFHPFDPVAYRIEPLVCEDYLSKRPVIVPYHRGGKRIHVGMQEFTEDIAVRSQAVARQFKSLKVKAVAALLSLSRNDTDEDVDSDKEKEKSYGYMMMERLTGSPDGRIDHVLQEKTFQHPYLSALGSHTNYWRDHDTALFILKHLYRDIPEEPPTDDPERIPIRLFYVRDPIAEETPLTFSDNSLVKEFSRKVRTYSRKPDNDSSCESS
uniref:DDHD domain-containing protein n=1 Tax=Leersia perrieri TaxID=77586 RepID=A0A0D9X3Q3_9ORYZ